MNILIFAPYYKPAYIYGGPVRSLSGLLEAMSQLKAKITVLTTDANGPNSLKISNNQPIDIDGVSVYLFPRLHNDNFFFAPALSRIDRRIISKADLIWVEGFWSYFSLQAAYYSIKFNIPFIVSLRGQLLPWSLNQKKLKKQIYLYLIGMRLLNKANGLYCTDFYEAESAIRLALKAPTFIIPNGVNAVRFKNIPRGELRKRLGIQSEAKVLLFLGRLHRKKRPDIAVETLAALQSISSGIHLIVAGHDEENLGSVLKNQAKLLGCANHLHIVGLLKGNEILYALADADLLLMPSEPESENFGMSAVEAMAAGVPIIVSEGVPVGRWAQDAQAGLMIPCKKHAFIEATMNLIADRARLLSMGFHGIKLVAKCFDLSVVAQKMLIELESIATTGKPLL